MMNILKVDFQVSRLRMYETVEGHIDMNQRKIAPMDSERLAKVLAIKKDHDLTGPVPYDIRLKIKDL